MRVFNGYHDVYMTICLYNVDGRLPWPYRYDVTGNGHNSFADRNRSRSTANVWYVRTSVRRAQASLPVLERVNVHRTDARVKLGEIQWQRKVVKTVQRHCLAWISLDTYRTCDLNAYCCMLFSSRIRVRIWPSVLLGSGYAHIIYTTFSCHCTVPR